VKKRQIGAKQRHDDIGASQPKPIYMEFRATERAEISQLSSFNLRRYYRRVVRGSYHATN